MSGTCLRHLESNFVILQIDYFVGCVALLQLDLGRALAVQTHETGGEEHRVLEVSLDLSLY